MEQNEELVRIPKEAGEEGILNAVRRWVDALAHDDYERAFEMTYHGPDEHWTPQLMRIVIRNYGSIDPGEGDKAYRITPIESAVMPADGIEPRHDVRWYEQYPNRDRSVVGSVWFDLPLNGEWSDLTATFDIRTSGVNFVLELVDIHVM